MLKRLDSDVGQTETQESRTILYAFCYEILRYLEESVKTKTISYTRVNTQSPKKAEFNSNWLTATRSADDVNFWLLRLYNRREICHYCGTCTD